MKTVSKSRASKSKSIVYDQHVLDYQDHTAQINAIIEEARIKAEENRMWAMIEPKQERKSSTKSSSGTKIKTMVDGIEFDSLAKAMAYVNPKDWGKESDYRTSHWTRINRALKKDGQVNYQGRHYSKI